MVRCINRICTNYNQELEDIKMCPLCGRATQKFTPASNPNLAIAAVITAMIAAVISLSVYGVFGIVVAIAVSAASIIMAFVSKRKSGIIVTLLSLAVVVPMAVSMFGSL